MRAVCRTTVALIACTSISVLVGTALPAAASAPAKKKITCANVLKPAHIEKIVGAPVALDFAQGDAKTVLSCEWKGDASDHVPLDVFFSDAEIQFAITRDRPLAGSGSIEPVKGVGSKAFFQLNAGGDTVAIWVLTRRASFSLANVNVNKDQATRRTEALALAKLVAKKLK